MMRFKKELVYFIWMIGVILPSFLYAQASYRVIPDVVYGHKAGMALTYDVIEPVDSSNGAALIHVISGGWYSRYNNPDSVADKYAEYLEKGYTVIPLRHGSAPYFKVPDMVNDIHKAVKHICTHAGDYGIDKGRIGIFGGSAGGQLALMAALDDSSHCISAVVSFFAASDLRNLPEFILKIYPALDFDTALAKTVSPILFVSPDDPPVLLIHGDVDFVVPEIMSENLKKELDKEHVPNKLVVIPGMGHGNTYGAKGKYYEEGNRELMQWFDKYLLKAPEEQKNNLN
jgi:acetyl esterase/lipase